MINLNENILKIDTVDLQDDKLVIIDQTKLPNETVILKLTDQRDIWHAIKTLQIRGAPAIGVAAAIGIYLAAKEIDTDDFNVFKTEFAKAKKYLASSRPTAVNLFWALDRMESVICEKPIAVIKELLRLEAIKIREEDIAASYKIGEYGLSLLHDGDGILTHCNAGQLATVRYGTALAPIHVGRERGMNFKVYTDETRPLLQGIRLSAYELVADGVDTTVICDNMASQVMKNGWIQAVITGADRIASNGDACNKIGTSGVAILAKYYKIPFYIAAPTSTIDMKVSRGEDITIEQRDPDEITKLWYEKCMAPEGAKVYNPAFDFVDNELITAIITEKGIIYPPFEKNLKEIMGE
ncbi:MAG: S-methyl-5-thioribose-1-phosphate isomerase [Oscillospiraceae bacterium]|nr:S-methyl-5-thioribose-1-phosphate isomerase [Oscillospiraceae bacterium]